MPERRRPHRRGRRPPKRPSATEAPYSDANPYRDPDLEMTEPEGLGDEEAGPPQQRSTGERPSRGPQEEGGEDSGGEAPDPGDDSTPTEDAAPREGAPPQHQRPIFDNRRDGEFQHRNGRRGRRHRGRGRRAEAPPRRVPVANRSHMVPHSRSYRMARPSGGSIRRATVASYDAPATVTWPKTATPGFTLNWPSSTRSDVAM